MKDAEERHYLLASKVSTASWGLFSCFVLCTWRKGQSAEEEPHPGCCAVQQPYDSIVYEKKRLGPSRHDEDKQGKQELQRNQFNRQAMLVKQPDRNLADDFWTLRRTNGR